MNEKGLAVGVLLIDTKPTNQNTKKVDITTTTAIRMMLDKAKNVDEALELLSSYDMHSSANSCYHFQICDASGKSVVVEYVDNEMKVVYPDKNYQCATNFLLTQPDAEFNFGQDRYQIIDEKLSSTNGKLSNREAMQLLSDCSQDAHKNKQGKISKTQWSCVYDLKNKKVTVCVNQNYDAKYTMKQNEQVLEAWLQMTTVINNERITPDLPYNESMICRYLYQNQDINVTATDLCNYMRMQKSQMNRTLTSMEKKELITRIRSEQDTRKIYITLNDSMLKIYKTQHEKILKIVDELFDKIGYERQSEVIKLFDLITQTAKEML